MIKVLPIGDALREDVPHGHKHFPGDCHLDLLSVLVPDDCLRITESVEEAVPGFRCRPGAFHHRLPKVLVTMCDSAGFDFPCALVISRFQACP